MEIGWCGNMVSVTSYVLYIILITSCLWGISLMIDNYATQNDWFWVGVINKAVFVIALVIIISVVTVNQVITNKTYDLYLYDSSGKQAYVFEDVYDIKDYDGKITFKKYYEYDSKEYRISTQERDTE